MPTTAEAASPLELRTCAACGARVAKPDVHKNRYGQYICRECRLSGVRAVGHKSLRYTVSSMPKALVLGATGLALVLLLILMVVLGSSLHSYSNGGMIEDIKDMVRSLRQAFNRH